MKTMALSGVFVLASAGLALATVALSDGASSKPEGTALISLSQDGMQAVIDKKDALDTAPTQAAADCTEDSTLPLCAEVQAKN